MTEWTRKNPPNYVERSFALLGMTVDEMRIWDAIASFREWHGQAARPLNSLGYKQAMQVLRGELSLEEAILAAQQGHRNYAKRQMTWFRREPDVSWIHGFGDQIEVITQAVAAVQNSLQPAP